MAKNKEKDGFFTTAKAIGTLLVMFCAAIGWLFQLHFDGKTVKASVEACATSSSDDLDAFILQDDKDRIRLKKEGCDIARKNDTNIQLVQKDISMIRTTQTAMQKEYKDGLEKVLEAIKAEK